MVGALYILRKKSPFFSLLFLFLLRAVDTYHLPKSLYMDSYNLSSLLYFPAYFPACCVGAWSEVSFPLELMINRWGCSSVLGSVLNPAEHEQQTACAIFTFVIRFRPCGPPPPRRPRLLPHLRRHPHHPHLHPLHPHRRLPPLSTHNHPGRKLVVSILSETRYL